MKKTILLLAILFSVNCKAQDTAYYLKRQQLYMAISKPVFNENDCQRAIRFKELKRRRTNRIYTIVATTIFTSISVWFWSGYKQ